MQLVVYPWECCNEFLVVGCPSWPIRTAQLKDEYISLERTLKGQLQDVMQGDDQKQSTKLTKCIWPIKAVQSWAGTFKIVHEKISHKVNETIYLK